MVTSAIGSYDLALAGNQEELQKSVLFGNF